MLLVIEIARVLLLILTSGRTSVVVVYDGHDGCGSLFLDFAPVRLLRLSPGLNLSRPLATHGEFSWAHLWR